MPMRDCARFSSSTVTSLVRSVTRIARASTKNSRVSYFQNCDGRAGETTSPLTSSTAGA
jgi:hypothetical protein